MSNLAQSAPTVRGTHSTFRLRIAALGAGLSCLGAMALCGAPEAGASASATASAIQGRVSYAQRVNLRKQSRGHHTRTTTTSPVTSTPAPSQSPASTPTKPTTPSTPTTPTKPTTPTTPTPPAIPTTPTTPTAPTPPTVPTTPGAGSIFTGAKIKDFSLLQAAPNAITEVSDPLGSGQQVMKMTVSDKDVAPITPTENPRAQALSQDIIHNGDEFWLSTKFLLPSDFPASVPGWMSLVSIYGAPFGGSSPWQIEVDGSNLVWTRNGTYNWDVPWQTPIVRGRWVSVLLHERFASDGWVEMWIDGAPVKFFSGNTYNPHKVAATEHLAMKTMDASNNGSSGNAAKIMNYRKVGMFSSTTVYFGALRVGTTRASVGG